MTPDEQKELRRQYQEWERDAARGANIIAELDLSRPPGALLYVVACAAVASAAAKEAIVDIDPTSAEGMKKFRDVQNDIRRYADLVNWIGAAVENGKEALLSMENIDRDDLIEEINHDIGAYE